jgi:hypothetical protein
VAVARIYNVDSGSTTGIAIGSTTPGSEFPIMWANIASTSEFNISAVRVGTYSGSSAFYPPNGTITWRLRRIGAAATFSAGLQGGTGTAAPVSQSTTPALSQWFFSTWTNATGTFSATGNTVWEQTIPCTAGANWGEWFTPGFEINCGPGQAGAGTIALTYEYGAAGTSVAVNLMAGLVISE